MNMMARLVMAFNHVVVGSIPADGEEIINIEAMALVVKCIDVELMYSSSTPVWADLASCVKNGQDCVQYTKWWDPLPDPAYAGALVHRVALYEYDG
jgi:hypothetical protein